MSSLYVVTSLMFVLSQINFVLELPQYLKEANWASENHVIACTQPRRVAATTVAARVAEEVGSVLGDEVSQPYGSLSRLVVWPITNVYPRLSHR